MKNRLMRKLGANKALVLLSVGFSALAVYVISCVYSPVGWSPDSSKIALFVIPGKDEPEIMAIFTYDIETGKRVLIDKMGKGGMLSAPAWSPDGKWLAYYKFVEPEKIDPNAADAPNAPVANDADSETVGAEGVLELFAEENKVRPAFVFEAGRDLLGEHDGVETRDIQLVVVGSDGKEPKITKTLRWMGDDDVKNQLLYLQPQWSADSQLVFYIRVLDDLGYVGSLNILTGQTEAHAFTMTAFWDLSPDGKWIAAPLAGEISFCRIDGSAARYFAVSVSTADGGETYVNWAGDSKRILLAIKNGFVVMDSQTGTQRVYEDTTAESIKYQTFSPDGTKVYYLAVYQTGDQEASEKAFAIRAVNLESNAIETITLLPEIPSDGDEGLGTFSVSPNGRVFIVRSILEDESGNDFNALIFFDGRSRKVVETDSWLKELIGETTP